MQISKNAVVAMIYTLKNDEGKVIDTNEGKDLMYYLHGYQNTVPGLERALTGKSAGDSVDVVVSPEDAYGEYDESRTFEVPLSELNLQQPPQKGMILQMKSPNGAAAPVTILKVKLRSVLMDGNHQLAGKTLHFSVKIEKIRKAKKDELKHGHAHAPGAHAH